jgi:hypothetical protein
MSYYLYGLQRSGTNIIQKFLETNYNISFSNNNKDRKSISHKHFRIYDNKNFIPQTNEIGQYHNNYYINSLHELDNYLLDFEHKNKYVIIYKDIFTWLPSIEQWSKKCKWKSSYKMDFVDDYLNFIKKWYSIKTNRVIFISYEKYLNIKNEKLLLNKLSSFFNINDDDNTDIQYYFDKVDHSSLFCLDRLNYYVNKEYMFLYTNEEIEKIKNNPIYIEYKNYDL